MFCDSNAVGVLNLISILKSIFVSKERSTTVYSYCVAHIKVKVGACKCPKFAGRA